MKEILHLEIHDWNEDILDPRILDLHREIIEGDFSRVFFNFSVTTIDMALVVCITTTKEDLQKYGLEFLDSPALKPELCPLNCFRKYNPETWKDPEKNGLYFDIDSYFRNHLWLCVGKLGEEYLTNYFPHHFEDAYVRDPGKVEKYYQGKYRPDFFNSYKDEVPVFTGYIALPNGFIESWLGRRMTWEDEAVEYKTFEFKNLDLWRE